MYTIPPQNKGHQTLPAVSKQLFYHSVVVFSKKPATPSPCCEFLTVTFVGAQDLDHRSFYQLLHGLHHLEGTQMEARSWGPWNDKTFFLGVRFSRWSCFNNRYMCVMTYCWWFSNPANSPVEGKVVYLVIYKVWTTSQLVYLYICIYTKYTNGQE